MAAEYKLYFFKTSFLIRPFKNKANHSAFFYAVHIIVNPLVAENYYR